MSFAHLSLLGSKAKADRSGEAPAESQPFNWCLANGKCIWGTR